MKGRIKRELKQVREAAPGRRFVAAHERTRVRNHALRLGLVALGVALMAAAAVTFWLPGPNFVLVLAGLLLVSGQSRTVAGWLDRGELAARRWHRTHWEPSPHKRRWKLLALLVVALALAATAWLAIEIELVPLPDLPLSPT